MAYTTSQPTGVPTPIEVDRIAGADFQRVKMTVGDQGSATDVSTTNPMPVVRIALSPAAPTYATVGVTSAQVIGANGTRKGLVLSNTSAANIFLGLGASAVVGSGIWLASGAVWVMQAETLTQGAINAIADAPNSNLGIQEFN